MKITGINIEKVQIPLKKLLKVVFTTVSYLESVLIQVFTGSGCIGFGKAAPFAPVTGETVDGVIAMLELFKTRLLGMGLMDIEVVHAMMDGITVGNDVVKCTVDLAIYGLMGESMGPPIYKLLGGYSNVVHNDITIGVSNPQSMIAGAKHLVETEGYYMLKVKAGINYKDDILAMKLIREAVGSDIHFRIDANQDYNVSDAVCALESSKEYGIEVVEQCLFHQDMGGFTSIHSKVNGVQIMLGGSIRGPMDAARACHLGAADILNIKLMKCSGLYPASEVNMVAEANGVTCMVGCTLEAKLAIAAGLSLVTAKKNVTEADRDSFLYYKEDPTESGLTQERDVFTLLNEPGFGMYFDM